MKKYIATILGTVLACATISAQSTDEPKQYLPKAGDCGIGVDLVPVLRTIGGTIYDHSTPIGGGVVDYEELGDIRPDVSINFKYMCTDNWALKINLGLIMKYSNERSYTTDDLQAAINPNSNKQVIDAQKYTRSGGTLQIGGEYRIGKRRVQGIFGFGGLIGYSQAGVNYSYGNAITSINQEPSSNIAYTGNLPYGYRVTEENYGGNCMLGAYGTIGAEWFVAPRISLGAEVNLALYGVIGCKHYQKGEGWNAAYQQVEKGYTQLVSPGNHYFNFGTQNLGGALNVTFYF